VIAITFRRVNTRKTVPILVPELRLRLVPTFLRR
jgi:hypothetical protein